MTGPEDMLERLVGLAFNILIINDQAYGGAGGLTLEDSRQNLNLIEFPA